jgi:hypothetical protein
MVGKMNQEMGLDSKFFYTNMYEIVTEIILCYRQYGTLFFAEKNPSTPTKSRQNGMPPADF